MTKEEAIVYGNDYYKDLITACCEIDEKHKEFVRMSLEALEQEPCEDCISRQAVIEHYSTGEIACCNHISRNNLLDFVEQLPPVAPQPKTGHWIYIGQSEINGLKICKCSECGRRTYGSLDYCGNCGAKMVETWESEGEK